VNFGPAAYLAATRHPLAGVLFVLPLLAAYEAGVLLLAPAHPEALRNGADVWLRWALASVGMNQQWWAPALLAGGLLLWAWRRRWDRPHDLLSAWLGTAGESALFALVLLGVGRSVRPFLDGFEYPLSGGADPEPAVAQMVCFLGAGIYEEALFRLFLFTALAWLLAQGDISGAGARLLAAAASALLFAAAHNVGPQGEAFDGTVFLFRTMAGMYFCALLELRGFGVAVGAHAGYDVLVGVVLPCA
jgi:membrane protease YdiL (CAAX protease family)